LHPSEIRRRLQNGDAVHFPDIQPNESPSDREARSILASLLLEMLDRPHRTVSQAIILQNAVILGDLPLAYAEFRCHFDVADCIFTGAVDCSFTKFATASIFRGCKFERDAKLRGAEVKGDLDWSTATFTRIDASHLTVGRDLIAKNATFRDDAIFDQMHVSGTAYFQGAQFQGAASFDLTRAEGGLDFGGIDYPPASTVPKTIFVKEARFVGAAVKAYASFIGVEFLDVACFDGMTLDGDARFDGAQFKPARNFSGSEFISFYGIRISGQTIFDCARFGAYVRFDQAHLEADSAFCSAKFLARSRFDNVVFGGSVRFNRLDKDDPLVEFMDSAEFVGASGSDIHFEGTEFGGNLSFRDANFKTVRFQDSENPGKACKFPSHKKWWYTRFSRDPASHPKIDLRGFCYERIFIDRETFFEILRITEPFELQPFRQAEKVLRSMGKDRDADKVYLAQRWRTLRYHLMRPKQHLLRGVGDLLYCALANFGVRPYRLAVYALVLITLSMFQFAKPNAVLPKKESDCTAHMLTAQEALGVSVTYFLPVDVPVGSCWQATRNAAVRVGNKEISFLLWATILRMAGWILVPLGVASLGGLLRRPTAT